MARITVMTYNIYRGGRMGAPLHRVVRAAAPDVLLVNECPKLPWLWRCRCHRLVDRWGMRYAGGGRPAGSNLIATSTHVAIEAVHAETLDQPPLRPRRGIAAAQLVCDGVPFGVVSCHLSLDPARRLTEVGRVVEVADGLRGPVMVAGDLNEGPGGPCWRRLRGAGYVDHGTSAWLTFPAAAPTKRIDAVLVRGAARVVHHGDPGVSTALLARASDHRPVQAILELG